MPPETAAVTAFVSPTFARVMSAFTVTLPAPAVIALSFVPLIAACTSLRMVFLTSEADTASAPAEQETAAPTACDLVTWLSPVACTRMSPVRAVRLESAACASTFVLKMVTDPTPATATAPPSPAAIATEPANAVDSTASVVVAVTFTLPRAMTDEPSIDANT